MIERFHYPVMLSEVLEGISVTQNKFYLDCTFGQGGYSEAFLKKGAYVVAFDQDESSCKFADEIKKLYSDKFTFILDNFMFIDQIKNRLFDGIVFDLGLSHTQLQDETRGFSFNNKNSLNMNMSTKYGKSVFDLINFGKEDEIANILYYNANEYKSRKIAKYIVNYRAKKSIETSHELAKVIASAFSYIKYSRTHVATKSFQALRIWANDELNALKVALSKSLDLLSEEGILCIVSFHSEEDRIVKSFIREHMIKINKKVIKPSREEVLKNLSSRSAVMRLAKKKVLVC